MGFMYSPTFPPSAETIVGKTDAIVKMECEGRDTSGEKQNRAQGCNGMVSLHWTNEKCSWTQAGVSSRQSLRRRCLSAFAKVFAYQNQVTDIYNTISIDIRVR